MNKKLFFAVITCLSILFFLSSCRITDNKEHTCEAGQWETVSNATCTDEGLSLKKCIHCDKILEVETIQVTDHSLMLPDGRIQENDSGCPDWVYFQACKDCDYEEIISTEKLHDYKKITTSSTCTTLGYDTLTCRSCGNIEIRQHTTYGYHIYDKEYHSDGDHHWNKCKNCDSIDKRAEHVEDETGVCNVCKTKVAYTDGVIYEISNDGSYAIVTGYKGSNCRVRILPEYKGVPVTHIGKAAFQRNRELYSVSLTDNITHIESQAFDTCPYLGRLFHMEKVIYIGDDAFNRNFELDLEVLPESLQYIGDNAFSECGDLTISIIPDSVSYLGSRAFYHCQRIKSIKINNALTEIKDSTFEACYNLGAVEFGDNIKSIGNNAFVECYYIETLHFPDGLLSIGENSFGSCARLKSVYLGKSLETIGKYAFNDCSNLENFDAHADNSHITCLEGVAYTKDLSAIICYPCGRRDQNLIIPEGVKTISEYAFYGMGFIKRLTLPASLTEIGYAAFRDCNHLESVTILGATTIGDCAFSGCRELRDLNLSDGVTTIGEFAFQDGGFVELVIPDSVTSMGRWAFASCYYLEKLTIGSGLKDIPEGAFIYCGAYLDTVIISEGVETIGEKAFAYCYDLRYVSIPDSVTVIGKNAFNLCNRLIKIVVGNGLLEVGEGAFAENTEIRYIFYKGDLDSWNNITIGNQNIEFNYGYRRYYYSESKPVTEGKYWHYDESGNAVVW